MEPVLKVEGVVKVYKGFRLDGVSFSLPRGFIMGLIGPNGAGKTTLIKLILNLIRRDAGRIEVCGLDAVTQEAEAKARIGFVPDEPAFYPDISLAGLKRATAPFYSDWDESYFSRLAGEWGLPLHKKFKTLSHGTKSKFALALALAHRPELVVLDEPTAGLDPVFRRELLDTLSGLLQEERVAVLFSTHITADLERVADYITYLQAGKVVFSSPREEVFDTWAVVKGGRDLLDAASLGCFAGLQRGEFGFVALTSRTAEVRERFGNRVVIERATLEDIMVLMGKEERHAA